MRFRRAVNLLAIVLITVATARLLMPDTNIASTDSGAASGSAPSQKPTLRIYDVREFWPKIVQEIQLRDNPDKLSRHIPQTNFGMGQQEVFTGFAPPGPTPTLQERATNRINTLLRFYASPDDWVDNGGSVATLHGGSGLIAVWHTPEGHRQIEGLLEAIRRADQIRWDEDDTRGRP